MIGKIKENITKIIISSLYHNGSRKKYQVSNKRNINKLNVKI